MMSKSILLLLLSLVVFGEPVFVYSSFWAPLFSARLLGYRVQARFAPGSGAEARADYRAHHGHRGETLIADLGNGNGPKHSKQDYEGYGEVQLSYTYPGAS